MDENKEMLENMPEEQSGTENEVTESAKPVDEKDFVAPQKEKKQKAPKVKKLKNQLLLKRGGYSLAITALFLVAVIIINVLVGALANRFNLEYDLSTDKVSTMDEKNIEYIKDIKQNIKINKMLVTSN